MNEVEPICPWQKYETKPENTKQTITGMEIQSKIRTKKRKRLPEMKITQDKNSKQHEFNSRNSERAQLARENYIQTLPRKPSTGDSLPLIPMMKAIRLRRGNNFRAEPGSSLNLTKLRRVFPQRQMRPRTIIIIHVIFHKTIKMTLAQNDNVVQTFSPNRTNEAFCDAILPVIGDNKNCLRNK